MRKSVSKPFQGGYFAFVPCDCLSWKKCQISTFRIHEMTKTNEKTSKQFELLHNALSVMPAELADLKDSFHQENSAMRRSNQARFGCPVPLYR